MANETMTDINWFPGHMTRAKRKIEQNLKLVDIIIEVIDARIPISSRNPDLFDLLKSKPIIVLLNKCDMADKNKTAQWIDYFKSKHIESLAVDCKTGKGLKLFESKIRDTLSDKIESWKLKGMVNRNIRAMVVGIPNVGKSSFINKISGNNKAKAEDRPGVTRGNQWFTISNRLEVLDTPGILWPKFDDPKVGLNLAFTGAVKDQVLDIEMLAENLLNFLKDKYFNELLSRYKLDSVNCATMTGHELLKEIGKKRGMLLSGGVIDTERAAIMLLDEFRSAKLGKITLEEVTL